MWLAKNRVSAKPAARPRAVPAGNTGGQPRDCVKRNKVVAGKRQGVLANVMGTGFVSRITTFSYLTI